MRSLVLTTVLCVLTAALAFGALAETADDDGETIGMRRASAAAPSASKDDDEALEIKLVPPRAPAADAALPGNSVQAVASRVDAAIEKNLEALSITPEPLCDDPTFLRRICLDLTGQIPMVPEIRGFMSQPAESRRSTLIVNLSKTPEFAQHWASFWTTVLLGAQQQRDLYQSSANQLRKWLTEHLRNNTPYDAWAEQLLDSAGSLPVLTNMPTDRRSPAIVYLGRHIQDKGLPETVGHVTRTFLGMRMGCAQCHDHPFDQWTQQDFWKLEAFFSYTSGSEYSLTDTDVRYPDPRSAPPDRSLLFDPEFPGGIKSQVPPPPKDLPVRPRGRQTTPKANSSQNPRGLLYRTEFARWLTDRANTNFDRMAVNRIWAAMLGHGFVEPVDDIRPKNPPTHPEAFDLLVDDFRRNGRDLRRLITIIAHTRAYQRSSFGFTTVRERLQQVRYAARAEVRPMTVEMVFCAILKSTGGADKVKTFLEGLQHSEVYNERTLNNDVLEFYTLLQQFSVGPDGQVQEQQSEQFHGTVTMALMLMHSPVILKLLRGAAAKHTLETLFATTLCRPPTAEEREATANSTLDDVLWALINTAEFVTIH